MVATLNYDARRGMKTLYQRDRWGVLSVLILHSDMQGHAWPTTKTICDLLDRCLQTVLDARNWLLEHKAIELVPYDKRIGRELNLPKRQFVYRLTGNVEIDGETIPYLYHQEPELAESLQPEDAEPEVLPDRTSQYPPEVLPGRSSTPQNLTIYSKDSSGSDSEESFTNVQDSSGAIGEPLPDGLLLYEWDIPDSQSEGLIHRAIYSTFGDHGVFCGYAHAASVEKEAGTAYIPCALCFPDEDLVASEKKTTESQLGKETRKNAPPAETLIPGGFKLITSTDSTELLHLVPADKGRLSQCLCKKAFSFRLFPTPGISQARKACPDCWRIANEPKPPKKPKPPAAHVQKVEDWMAAVGKDMLPTTITVRPYVALGKVWAEANEDLTCAGQLYRAWIDSQPGKPALTWDVGEVTNATRLALGLCKNAITADDVQVFVKAKRAEVDKNGNRFWNGKLMPFKYIAENIATWKADRVPKKSTASAPLRPEHRLWIKDPATGQDLRYEPCHCEIGHDHDA